MTENAFEVNGRGRAVEPGVTDDEKTWSLMMHLSLLAHVAVPYISFLIPLFMWLNKKDKSRYIDDHGREALNFQITLMIYSLVVPILALVAGFLTCGVGLVIAFLPAVLGVVGIIMASMAANRGEYFRYPMTIRFLN